MNKLVLTSTKLVTSLAVLCCVAIGMVSCGGQTEKREPTVLKVYCDQAIYDLVIGPCMAYDSAEKDVELIVKRVSAFEAMAMMLNGEADISFISRLYTHREDSLMKLSKVPPRFSKVIANDALVFFAAESFPTDTISAEQMHLALIGKKSMASMFPKINGETEFVMPNELSSEYENARQMIAENVKISARRKYFASYDSVVNYVKSVPNTIGIGYYSQIYSTIGVKALSVSFADSAGNYVFPHVVHQSNIIQKLYPFVVNHYIYVLDQDNNEAMRFLRYIRSPKGPSQRHFLEKGIVPAVGEFRLTPLYD